MKVYMKMFITFSLIGVCVFSILMANKRSFDERAELIVTLNADTSNGDVYIIFKCKDDDRTFRVVLSVKNDYSVRVSLPVSTYSISKSAYLRTGQECTYDISTIDIRSAGIYKVELSPIEEGSGKVLRLGNRFSYWYVVSIVVSCLAILLAISLIKKQNTVQDAREEVT